MSEPDPAPGAARGKVFIVLNVGSGRPDDTMADAARRVLGGAGIAYEILEAHRGSEIAGLAKRAVAAARVCGGSVVAAGGDGTLNAVAEQVLGSGCPYGVLPQGTFNYFARAHGIPTENDAALRVIVAGNTRPVQVGLVNDRVFLVNASVGLYPQVLEDREAYKQRFGRFRVVAMLSAMATLLREPRQLHLLVDEDGGDPAGAVELRTPTVFVGNNRLQLEQIGVPEANAVEAGRLVVIVLEPVGTWTLVGLLLRGALGRLGEANAARSFATASLSVTKTRRGGARRLKIATDGEVRREAVPLRFHVAPEPLMLIAPADWSGGDSEVQ